MIDLLLLRSALRDLVRPRRIWPTLILSILPAFLYLLARWTVPHREFHPGEVYELLSADLLFGPVLVLPAVIFATGALSQEMEQKTIVYLLTRPLPRWRILLAKFVAAVVAVIVAVLLSWLLLALWRYGFSHLDRAHPGRDCASLAVGAAAYSALFLLAATLFRRPLLWGLFFAFGWESWVPSLPGSFGKLSLMAYLRALAPHNRPESDTVDLTQMAASTHPAISHSLAWWVLTSVTLGCLILALVIFSNGQYVPRDDAD